MRSSDDILRERPELFFGPNGPTARKIASDISSDALMMGCTSVHCWTVKDWWFVAGDVDWFNVPNMGGVSPDNAFDSIWGMPEAGQNFFWHTVFAKIYGAETATSAGGTALLVKGEPSSLSTFESLIVEAPHQERIVGFRFSAA